MTKDSFVLEVDADTGNKYIAKKNKYTKNHREKDHENLPGFMPEMPDSESCPVQSYLKYVSKLNQKGHLSR